MKTILENVIRNGKMPLREIGERIDTMYVSGRISADQRAELNELMYCNAKPENEIPDWQTAFRALEERVAALEEKAGGSGAGEEYGIPAWKPWDGVSRDYEYGAVVTHGGKVWKSVYAGQNVWEPSVHGWTEVE